MPGPKQKASFAIVRMKLFALGSTSFFVEQTGFGNHQRRISQYPNILLSKYSNRLYENGLILSRPGERHAFYFLSKPSKGLSHLIATAGAVVPAGFLP